MDGILNVRKPAGPTSHDVVAQVRRIVGQKRVGHAGTLDPMAEGVLVVCLGKATRLVQFLVGEAKEYRCVLALGAATDTQDGTGRVTEEQDASWVTAELLQAACGGFVGDIEQVPPMVSAVKHQGKRLYEIARRGESVERQPRRVSIYSLDVCSFTPGVRASAEMVVRCSSGTYIRTLCEDIGEKLGCPAHMGSLVRLKVGRFSIETAASTQDLEFAAQQGRLDKYVLGMETAVAALPQAVVTDANAAAAAHGARVACETEASSGSRVRITCCDGKLIGIGLVERSDGEKWVKPRVVLVDSDQT